MGPGFNRYAVVLTLLAAGIGVTGCSNGSSGSKGGFASTVAPSTSATPVVTPVTTAVITSTATPAPRISPTIVQAAWEDKDGDGRASKGDVIRISYDREIKFKTTKLDAAKELAVAVAGDTLGAGATLEADTTNAIRAVVTLGADPSLHVGGVFTASVTQQGAPSGLNVSTTPTGQVVNAKDEGIAVPNSSTVDVGGNATTGFRDGANLVIARGAHTATLLDDGRVLIVGGMRDGKNEIYCEEAELFDPATGQFTTVSQLSGAKGKMYGSDDKTVCQRINHQATKLADGSVLITGGYGIQKKTFFGLGSPKKETLDVAHVFDPKTNTFSRVGSLNADRHSHTATLLRDGRVLIAGGHSDSFWSRNKTEAPYELYDPKTKKFKEEKSFIFFPNKTIEKRQNHAAVALDDGALLVGGEHWEGGFLHFFGTNKLVMNKGSEVFKGDKFARSGDLKAPRRYAPAAMLPSKDVVIVGGNNDKTLVSTIETWSEAAGQWSTAATLLYPRTNARVAVLGEDAFVIGGFKLGTGNLGGTDVKGVEVFHGATKKLTNGYSLKLARNGCAAVTLKDGRILVTGGFAGSSKNVIGLDGQAMASTELFVNP